MLALRELVERALAEGEIDAGPPRELATILSVLLHGLAQLQITRHLHEPRTIDGDTPLDELLALALAALRPPRCAASQLRDPRRTAASVRLSQPGMNGTPCTVIASMIGEPLPLPHWRP